ncbi:MAG TPA: glycosyltransferase [Pirellulales bacterium]
MRLSVIIAAHSEGQALAKTVASCVESCAGLDYEILVADDASWDGSLEEVERRFSRVRVLNNLERQGPAPTIVPLDVGRWRSAALPKGHGYRVDLEHHRGTWLPLDKLRVVEKGPRRFYESPVAIGCAFAVRRYVTTFSRATNTNPDYVAGYNNWQTKVVEGRADGSTNTVYCNYVNDPILAELAQGEQRGHSGFIENQNVPFTYSPLPIRRTRTFRSTVPC